MLKKETHKPLTVEGLNGIMGASPPVRTQIIFIFQFGFVLDQKVNLEYLFPFFVELGKFY